MTECCGIFGKWFGHKFKKYNIRKRSNLTDYYEAKYISIDELYTLINSSREIYEIRCKRCGAKPDE